MSNQTIDAIEQSKQHGHKGKAVSGRLATGKELIHIGANFSSAEELMNRIADSALEQGYIEPHYRDAISEREKEFPTGLDLPIPIAIPHTDAGCITPFIAVATLTNPIPFYSMDLSGDIVHVQMVFQLGIQDGATHRRVLKKLALAFSRKEDMEELLYLKEEAELLEKLNLLLDGLLAISESGNDSDSIGGPHEKN
ncbi:PTS sugar transporter subunit IIA [Anoxybacterium hadale]|uniref:PTS sugar transporter subunit IIA n=1 Tax=Anoxybacterium hadale TaxID=3408580 RepID=A0ACD1A7B1_9FIRM|nr:PTS sugar transporter subunit IIA [Clostridiales bacterium]